MKVLLIVCAGGCTSSLMVQKIEKHAKEKGIKLKTGHLSDYMGEEDLVNKNKDLDLFISYGSAEIMRYDIQEWKHIVKGVLISPQVRFYHKNIKAALDPLNIPCDVIDSIQFGRMQADLVLEQGLKLINF